MNKRKFLKYVAGGTAVFTGAGAAGFVWLDRKYNPKTPLNYAFPDSVIDGKAQLLPTPSCGGIGAATPQQTEGPYYAPDTPERSELRDVRSSGTPLIVEGVVIDTQCRPVSGAVIDMWSCDHEGIYDNDGTHLRGHQFTDSLGFYRFSTVRPAPYKAGFTWRSPHIHAKVQGKNTSLLTTQLYFPGEALNESDSIFDPALLFKISQGEETAGALVARYDFVLG